MKKPNKLQTAASVTAGKLTRTILRLSGKGGTAVPGIVAMKVSRDILAAVSEGMKIVLVTGTNGKTTTCNMIEHALTYAGFDCLLNKSGANLLHGIASDMISETSLTGRPKHPYAVLECDEAALKQVVPYLKPKAIVVTNLFSDQVDRYGGVEKTLEEIRAGVHLSPESILVLNADEPLSASLGRKVPNPVIWYGFDRAVGQRGDVDLTDAGKCPECGGEYKYDYHIYAHLGGYRCPACGYKRHDTDVTVKAIERMDAEGSNVLFRPGKNQPELSARISLPAVYNIYNAAAAVAACLAMNAPLDDVIASLSNVRSSFGRLETFDLNGIRLQMILVKNPAGCNQAFSYVTGLGEDFSAVLCLNNRTGDGHDISWIEDTDYEMLCRDPHLQRLYVGGDRAGDLRERLLWADAKEQQITMIEDYPSLVETLKTETCPVFLLPNYTAMMELRQALSASTGSKDFWE